MLLPITLSRVNLKLITHKHANELLAILNHNLVARYNDYPVPMDRAQIKQLIQDDISGYYEGEVIRAAIEHNTRQAVIGSCGLYKICNKSNSAFLGFELHPDYWQQGLMHEALAGFIPKCMAHYKLNILYAKVFAHNERCKNLLVKIGFKLHQSENKVDNELLLFYQV